MLVCTNKAFTAYAQYIDVVSIGKLALAINYCARVETCLPMKPDQCSLRFNSLSGIGPNSLLYSFSFASNNLGDISSIS